MKIFDERAFIKRVEAAGPEELADILARPTVEEEKALRAHLGDERYQRMRGMALKRNVSRSLVRRPKGNVVVIHGIMGAELTVSSGGAGDLTWVNAFRIMRGWLNRLRLGEDGRAEFDPKFQVRATGIMKRYYGELLLALAERWQVRAFWFDWRKDLSVAADELNVQINSWFGDAAPAHIVAHSMGGLVARTFIRKYRGRWEAMDDKESERKAGGRLIMLGTPNHGSFAIPQVITGIEGLVKKLALLDLRHGVQDLLGTFNSFVGSYQMLPSPLAMSGVKAFYDSGTYSRFNVSVPQRHLTNALDHHQLLEDEVDPERMIYVAGYDQPTFSGVRSWAMLNSVDGYELTWDGDGRVPHKLGLLRRNGKTVPTFYIREDHGNLSSNAKILAALDELLETGTTDELYDDLNKARSVTRGVADEGQEASREAMLRQLERQQREDEARLQNSLRRMGTRGLRVETIPDPYLGEVRAEEPLADGRISPEERKVEEAITRGFLSYRGEERPAGEFDDERVEPIEEGEIEIGLLYGGIESIPYGTTRSAGGYAIDALAVGHYIGVQPVSAELALDRAISAALMPEPPEDLSRIDKADLVLTQYTERGIIHGRLGQPFFLPDPRAARGRRGATEDRIIVIAGMDEPGRFGVPELTVLARELCWSLGRMKRRHLATVLIGSGAGNLLPRDSVVGWMEGIRRAVTGSSYDAARRLQRVTFVEIDPRRVVRLGELLAQEAERQKRNGFHVKYRGLGKKELEVIKADELEAARHDWKKRWEAREDGAEKSEKTPARVTLGWELARKAYRYGAITSTASVPEREIMLDPAVVMQANDELAGEQNHAMQKERGRFLEQLLMPADLRRELYNNAPLVMMLDATTARIHWEMIAQPALATSAAAGGATAPLDGDAGGTFDRNSFLGTSRGFTRQLRTTFAPPPEPPPPPRRVLRVLVVADPAPDAHLPGAQEEGAAVADLFESYNVIYKERLEDTRVKVVRLFGPLEATRTNVLRELTVRQYDVLHFAGHCVYRWGGNPTLSGWIFNAKRKEVLSANELNRIDRIPKFVFSNACESGITPDRSQERSVDLAPSFAEAFFARGVANFVCTAWPVDDLAARLFALTLYSGLLGLNIEDSGRRPARHPEGFRTMHEAMREARISIALTPNGRTTWGAYQHYGNPFFQFFYSVGQKHDQPEVATGRDTAKRGRAKRAASKGRGRK